jgi:rare lipoprotein A (peptidoglycan hydrolase)
LLHQIHRKAWTLGCSVRLASRIAVTGYVSSCSFGYGIDENGVLMITRSKRVWPGLVMTLLLSVPAMAATADAAENLQTGNEPKVNGAANNGARAKADTKAVVRSSSSDRVAVKLAPATRTSGRAASAVRSRSRDVTPALLQSASGRSIHRVSATEQSVSIDSNLIDDGTLWRERGTVATWQQTGMASWYGGERWQGHRTSSGSQYDQNELTAAHATLPLGTKVRVTSHSGTRSVIVTINDRPGTRTRIIDLSRQAARELGILDAGVAMVTLQPM